MAENEAALKQAANASKAAAAVIDQQLADKPSGKKGGSDEDPIKLQKEINSLKDRECIYFLLSL